MKTGIVTENDPQFSADYVVENFNEATQLIWNLEALDSIKDEEILGADEEVKNVAEKPLDIEKN